MPTLVICRGIPASGKTTLAKQWLKSDPENRARVNRDDLRKMLNNGHFIKGVTEGTVIKARDLLIRNLLRDGKDVISDDTNLPARTVKDLMKIAQEFGAEVKVLDFTDVPLETCIARDKLRAAPVGISVITDMYNRFVKGRKYPLDVPELAAEARTGWKPYRDLVGAPMALMVDLDGTLALLNGRNPYDASTCENDLVNGKILSLVQWYSDAGFNIILMSGRSEKYRPETERWLQKHYISYHHLYMRPEGDNRRDSIVKMELFDKYVRNEYRIEFVLDDRDQVVRAWRSIGLTVLQVAEGDF